MQFHIPVRLYGNTCILSKFGKRQFAQEQSCASVNDPSAQLIRDGPFDIQGGGAGIFLKKIVRFPLGAKKLKCLQRS